MNKAPYRVLCLDGGGMRGLYTMTVLEHLGRRFGGTPSCNEVDIATGFNLVVGSSTGAIEAAALALGVPTAKIIDFYLSHGPRIFVDPMPKKSFALLRWILRHWNTPGNAQGPLKAALTETFGPTTLQELWQKRSIGLCVTTVDLLMQHPRVFKTPHNPKKLRDNNWTLRDVCLASSAAPVYLPIARVSDPDTPSHQHAFVDGGLWANNPTLVGLIEALEMAGKDQPIEIISVGTCSPPIGRSLGEDSGEWGFFKWGAGSKVAETAMESSAHGTNYAVQFLASHLRTKCRILRLEQSPPSVEHIEDIGLDRTSKRFIEAMTSLGRRDADEMYGKLTREPNSPYLLLQDIFTNAKRY